MFDVITIGSATIDFFVECDDATIVSLSATTANREFMCYPYGSKLEITNFSRCLGGGGINTAINFSKLGLKTSAIFKVGDDEVAQAITAELKKHKINSNLICAKNEASGFSIILVSFQGDRTVLAHRGANAQIKEKDIDFESIKNSKWLYIAPLSGESNKVLDKIADFAQNNGVNMAINAGTTAIKKGAKYFDRILETAEIVVMNKDEAQMLTKIQVRPDTKNEKFSKEIIHPDIKEMLVKLRNNHDPIVLITDGKKGVYAYDGKKFYQCPEFPAKVVSTLGAGDAFASTFVASMEKTNWDIEKSLKYASVNAAGVVSVFGAQEGLSTFEQLEKKLKKEPNFKVKIVK